MARDDVRTMPTTKMTLLLRGAVAFSCLLVAAGKLEVKYTDLRNAVINTNMQLSFTLANISRTQFPSNSCKKGECECPFSTPECRARDFNWDDDAMLFADFTLPADVAMLTAKSIKDEVYGPPTQVTIKACYAKPWTAKRKWRKIKNVIDDDKRCTKKFVKNFDITRDGKIVTEETLTAKYTIPSDIPEAEWFLTMYFKCPIKDSTDSNYCGLDSTVGDLSLLMSEKDLKKDVESEDEVKSILEQPKSKEIYYRTTTMDGRPTSLVIGVIILSLGSVSLLISYFAYEKLLKKRA